LRRNLALPFVFTSFLSPAAFGDAAPPNKPPTTAPTAPPTANPPPQRKLPNAPDPNNVIRREDGTCWYHHPQNCPPGAHCTPPPYEVACPPKHVNPPPLKKL